MRDFNRTGFTRYPEKPSPLRESSRPLAADVRDGRDFCFRVGPWGFVFMDLRTNRNLKQRRILTAGQADRIRQWVEDNRQDLHTLFMVSTVVFSHGSPPIEDLTVTGWPLVMRLVEYFARFAKWGRGLQTKFKKSLGDIRDDIKDSWACKENGPQADMVLDFLFGLQNDAEHPVGVVILSGDIHTPGYASIYSSDPAHAGRSSIAHITSSPVSCQGRSGRAVKAAPGGSGGAGGSSGGTGARDGSSQTPSPSSTARAAAPASA